MDHMNVSVKTTVILPVDLMEQAKLTAISEHTNVSELIREALSRRVRFSDSGRSVGPVKNPLRYLGSLSRGAGRLYGRRSELYETHLRRKAAR